MKNDKGTVKMRKVFGKLWRATIGQLEGQYVRYLCREVSGSCGSLLDVGCGFNSPVQFLHPRPRRLVGVDAFAPVLEQSQAAKIHDEYRMMTVLDMRKHFKPEEFECVLASDLLEHLSEQDGLALIQQMECIARKKVIIYTPNGFLKQGEEYGNPLQRHLSGWTVGRMRALGYRVMGMEGFRPLRGNMAEICWRPTRFWHTVSLLSQLIVTQYPRFAFRLLCVKDRAPEIVRLAIKQRMSS